MSVNYPAGLIKIYHCYPYQTSLVDSIYNIPIVYSAYDGAKICFKNTSSSTMKYVTFTYRAFNSVQDFIKTVGGSYEVIHRITGPIKPQQIVDVKTDGQWQNGMVKGIVVIRIEMIFMDGSNVVYTPSSPTQSVGDFYKEVGLEMYDMVVNGKSSNGACYVATCVYGSYDCPEVWTLRRFRDYDLARTMYGRTFVKVYYAISPTIVKIFGKTRLFNKVWKPVLDNLVRVLQNKGYEATPYEDREW